MPEKTRCALWYHRANAMSRILDLQLEPSDAFGALLRAKAAAESGRWPQELSTRLRAVIDAEFVHLEAAVATLGRHYSTLEARGLAELDRSGLSRFEDINNALHLVALPITLAVDLVALQMAVTRGDAATRESTTALCVAVRQLLWYAAHSDLLVCASLSLAGAEMPPQKAIQFVDAVFGVAWRGTSAPEPPDPRKAFGQGGFERETMTPETPMPLVNPLGGDATAMMRSPLPAAPDELPRVFNEQTNPTLQAAPRSVEMGRDSTSPVVSLQQVLGERL